MKDESESSRTAGNAKQLALQILSRGFEPGDGHADGAMQVYGQWWVPKWRCDSLEPVVDAIACRVEREYDVPMATPISTRLTASAAARHLGCSRDSVLRAARRLGLGEQIVGGALLLTPAETDRLRAEIRIGQPGNPEFGKRNYRQAE